MSTLSSKTAKRIARLAIEHRAAELAIEAAEGTWQPGHLDRLLGAYRRRARARNELNAAIDAINPQLSEPTPAGAEM